jgi:hypothetical protein
VSRRGVACDVAALLQFSHRFRHEGLVAGYETRDAA